MNNFLDRFKPKANALQNALSQNLPGQKFKGTGQSLGGGDSHFKIIPIQLHQPGPLGMGVEKMKSGGCVVSSVEVGSQGEKAGILRGDVVCFDGSNGKEEVAYAMFLQLAKAKERPLCFEVRRAASSSVRAQQAAAQQQQQQQASSGWLGGGSNSKGGGAQSAEAYARKQAMIAAAEAREKANKAKLKPISRGGSNVGTNTTANNNNTPATTIYELPSDDPKSEAARAAVEAAKIQEKALAQELGYNPYETNRATAGQARNATVALNHGTIQSSAPPPTTSTAKTTTKTTSTTTPTPNVVRPPQNTLLPENDNVDSLGFVPIHPEFDHALESFLLSNTGDTDATTTSSAKASLSVIRKLIVNATTKGQVTGAGGGGTAANSKEYEDAAKFRRVRLANPKIAAAVVEPPGAIDLMLSTGFTITEDEASGESVLVYPITTTPPAWLPAALKRLEQVCGEQ